MQFEYLKNLWMKGKSIIENSSKNLLAINSSRLSK